MKEPEALQQVDRTYVRFRGRKLSYFSGCDYFRLASHPGVVKALVQGVKNYGLNVAASRLTTGNHVLYQQLERRLAEFFGTPTALLTSSGYMTDIAVAQALAGNFSHALMDAESHPAVSDAARFLDCPVLQFRHRNADDLARTVRRCGAGARLLVLTEGLFARDGTIAPLAEYVRQLPKDAWMLVDDAHGGGVLGRTGKGSLECAGVGRARIIQTITLSKAFGAYGGAILASADLRRNIINKSRLFVGSTPLPLPLANAALQSIEILKNDRRLRKRLEANVSYVRKRLGNSRLTLSEVPSPIIMFIPQGAREASQLKLKLLQAGLWPSFIRYPTGPDSGYFRFVISSEHTRQQLDTLVAVLAVQ